MKTTKTTTEAITRADLEGTLQIHTGNRLFDEAIQQGKNERDLLYTLANYIMFNSVFGGGAANLTGEVAVRQYLFRDPEEPIALLADKSVDVAAFIFDAVIDEFGERTTAQRYTHRSLAQQMYKTVGNQCNLLFWP